MAFLKGLTVIALSSSLLSSSSETTTTSASSGEYTATSFHAVDGRTNVSIRLSNASADQTHGTIVFTVHGSHGINLKWMSSRSLLVSCSSCRSDDVSLEVVRFGNAEITYTPQFSGSSRSGHPLMKPYATL